MTRTELTRLRALADGATDIPTKSREIEGAKRQRKLLKRLLRERHIDDTRPFRMEKR